MPIRVQSIRLINHPTIIYPELQHWSANVSLSSQNCNIYRSILSLTPLPQFNSPPPLLSSPPTCLSRYPDPAPNTPLSCHRAQLYTHVFPAHRLPLWRVPLNPRSRYGWRGRRFRIACAGQIWMGRGLISISWSWSWSWSWGRRRGG